jgi:hypothetical protein
MGAGRCMAQGQSLCFAKSSFMETLNLFTEVRRHMRHICTQRQGHNNQAKTRHSPVRKMMDGSHSTRGCMYASS